MRSWASVAVLSIGVIACSARPTVARPTAAAAVIESPCLALGVIARARAAIADGRLAHARAELTELDASECRGGESMRHDALAEADTAIGATSGVDPGLARARLAEALRIETSNPARAEELALEAFRLEPSNGRSSILAFRLARAAGHDAVARASADRALFALEHETHRAAAIDLRNPPTSKDPFVTIDDRGVEVARYRSTPAPARGGERILTYDPGDELGSEPRLCVFTAVTGELVRAFPIATPPSALTLSPDGNLATAIEHDAIRVYRVRTGELAATLPPIGAVRAIVISPDSSRIAVLGNVGESLALVVRLFETATFTKVADLPSTAGSPITFSADSARLAIADAKGKIRIVDGDHGRTLHTLAPRGAGRGAIFGHDPDLVITASSYDAHDPNDDGFTPDTLAICAWSLSTGRKRWCDTSMFLNEEETVALSVDARDASVSAITSQAEATTAIDIAGGHAAPITYAYDPTAARGNLSEVFVAPDRRSLTAHRDDGTWLQVDAVTGAIATVDPSPDEPRAPASWQVTIAGPEGLPTAHGTAVRIAPVRGSSILVAIDPRSVVAITEGGHAELLGDGREHAVCRIGHITLPVEMCEDRLVTPGILARALAATR